VTSPTSAIDPPRLFAYTSSHTITHIAGGLLRKDLSDGALTASAQATRHDDIHLPQREPAVYRHLLAPLRIGPRCVASGDDWIVVEHLDARPLWQIGDPATWIDVARWTASCHSLLGDLPSQLLLAVPLARYDAQWYETCHTRAALAGVGASLLDAHRRARAHLAALPTGLIHGELYSSNVLAGSGERATDGVSGTAVWPVDWEMTGVGPHVLDVAALTAGAGLSSATRAAMEEAYFETASSTRAMPSMERWRVDLAAARVQIGVQWLGWSPTWRAPAEHDPDWPAATALAAEAFDGAHR